MSKGFLLSILGIMLLVAFLLCPCVDWKSDVKRNACLNNLRMLTSPMTCCVPLSMRLKDGDTMDPRTVLTYIKGAKLPECPSGGYYIISWIVGGPTPKCSVHGDLLWEFNHVRTLKELEDGHEEALKTQQRPATPPIPPRRGNSGGT